MADDRFCTTCGTLAANGTRPTDTERQRTHGDTATPVGNAPLYSHEPPRPSGPLNAATRYLCAAAYLNHTFAKDVIKNLLASRRAVAPSVNFDVGPVLRHCLRARRNILIRDVVLMVILVAGLIIRTKETLDFLLFAVSLGYLLPSARRRRGGPIGTVMFTLGAAAGGALAVAFMSALVFGGVLSSLANSGSTAGGESAFLGIAFTFILLLAATWTTEFAYVRITFQNLNNDLQGGSQSPRAVSTATEQRIAIVENAQWGNITLHSRWFPFIGAGLPTQANWSVAIRLHPKKSVSKRLLEAVDDEALSNGDGLENHENSPVDKDVHIDPVDLHRRIRERLAVLNDPALPESERITALTVSDRIVGSGLLGYGSPLIDEVSRTPYSHASREAVEALIRNPQARLRYYQQVSVSDEGPSVMSGGRTVIQSVDQEIAVSAFIYAAVEGHMFYLQYVLTALPPIDIAYRIAHIGHGQSFTRTLIYSMKRLFSSFISAPVGIYTAFQLWREERQSAYLSSIDGDFGTEISIRQMAAAPQFGTYIEELDVDKYNKMLSRLLLETVQEYLDTEGVDTRAFGDTAQTIINNGDINYIRENNANIDQFGGRHNAHSGSSN
jgi:hypothetical protein